jgi:hypothetical protein
VVYLAQGLCSTGIWMYDFETANYPIPLGIGVRQVIPRGKTVHDAFIEPPGSAADRDPAWPEWQIFVGFNMRFLGKREP